MKSKKSIAMVGTSFDTMGGIASVVNVYRRSGLFERQGILYFATHADGSNIRKLIFAVKAWISFMVYLIGNRFSLVHAHVSSRASFWRKSLFLIPSITLGVPTILHLHGSEFRMFYDLECGPLRKRVVSAIFDKCSRVIVLSQDWHSWVSKITTNVHVQVLFNPVEVHDRRVSVSPGASPVVLSLGRLGMRKGSYDLLAAASELKKRGLNFRLRLGGDGELERVKQRAVELDIEDRLDLLGWVTGPMKAGELKQATVFALPSYNEGLPMAILEAMAAGVPIVATPIGGIPDAIREGIDGFLVSPGDVDGLIHRLQTLLTELGRNEEMGMSARRRCVEFFSTEAIIPQLEAVYNSILLEDKNSRRHPV